LCGYIGETYGWHYGFGLATFGMLVGLAIFAAPTIVTQLLIGGGALGAGAAMVWSVHDDRILLLVNLPIALALVVAAVLAMVALRHGAIPDSLGHAPDEAGAQRKQWLIVGGTLALIPVFGLLVHLTTVAGIVLLVFGIPAFGYIFVSALRSSTVERQRLFVVLIMCFFSMLFWAFFEQAGSSMNNFADRNVDRVREERVLTAAEVGQSITLEANQEQLGYARDGKVFTLDQLDALKKEKATKLEWKVEPSHVGMGVGGKEVPASIFQAANPTFILLFGLAFTALWGALAKRKIEPSTPAKFALGLLQLCLGFAALWWGAQSATGRGMVGVAVALARVPAPHDRRALPLADRSQHGDQALTGGARLDDHGRLVPRDCVFAVPRGHHRGAHGRVARRRGRRGRRPSPRRSTPWESMATSSGASRSRASWPSCCCSRSRRSSRSGCTPRSR
jgi:proton-dependent oligopeptide transporter, POT family